MQLPIRYINEQSTYGLFKNNDKEVVVKGWVRTIRNSTPIFVVINDGSTCENLQLVFDPNIIETKKVQ